MKNIYYFLLCVIVFLTVGLRLYRIDAPVADWHSFRQVDTASVARIFAERGIDLLHPRYHDLSNIQSGKDNPQGWRMVEFPMYQALAAALSNTYTGLPLEVWLRLISVASAAGTAVLLVLLLGGLRSPVTSLAAGFVYAVMPYSIFFGRTILPETFAVFWAMLSLYTLHKGTGGNWKGWLHIGGSALFAALAILVKPTAGFLLLPVPYIVIRNYGLNAAVLLRFALFGLVALGPVYWWRNWILQYPEGIAVYDWLFNKGNIRFKGAWFQWLFAERLGKLMLGYWGLLPFGLGVLSWATKKDGRTLPLMGLGSLLYLSVFAAGNVQHDYYQIILIPVVSAYVARGIAWLVTEKTINRIPRVAVLTISMTFMLAFSWYTMRTYYWINRPEIVEAGRFADTILPKNAKVIAPYNGDTTFLYQTKRSGWPLGFDIDEKIEMGATHYVTVSPTDADFETMTLANTYVVLERNDRFAIIDLTKKQSVR